MRLNIYEDSELDVLEEYLSSDDAPEHCMTLSELDGFLAGLVAGPEAIDEREWMPLVWGGEVPVFHDSDHSADVLRAIFHRRRVIEEELRDEDGTYLPILWETEDGVRIAEDWAQGFAGAIELRLDAWDALIRHKKFGFLILPIAGLLRDENGLPLLPQEDIDEVDPEDLMELISPSVAGSYAFWRMREAGYGEAPPRKAPKIGRNDPCPCGSGKKYKKCCG